MIWWKYLPDISHKIWSVKRPWKTREMAVKKPVKSHQKLAPKFYSFVWVFCSLLTGFSLKSLELLVISSSLATYRLEIGWCVAVVAESVECMWGLAGFPLYMLFIYIYYEGTWYKRFFWTCFATPFLGSQAETMISAWCNCSVEFCQWLKSPHNWKTLGASCHFLFGKLAVQTNV